MRQLRAAAAIILPPSRRRSRRLRRVTEDPDARVGIVDNLSPIEPVSGSAADPAATVRADSRINRWRLDPSAAAVTRRACPACTAWNHLCVRAARRPSRRRWTGSDRTTASGRSSPRTRTGRSPAPGRHSRPAPGTPPCGSGVPAECLEQALRLAEEYGARRFRVAENGSAHEDAVRPGGSVHGPERTRCPEEHLAVCARAVGKGAPPAGHFARPFLDDFEWAYG